MSETPREDLETRQASPAPHRARQRRSRTLMGVILALLIFLLALASYLLFQLVTVPSKNLSSTSAATGLEWVRSIYGTGPAADQQFVQTQAAVTAPDGTIWIDDSKTRSLMQFTVEGRFLGDVTGPADWPLTAPARFAISPDGVFYVVDPLGDVVRMIDSRGTDVGSFAIPRPVSVAVSNDRVVVGTIAGFAILERSGKPIKVIGARGSGADDFDYVHGVAIGADGTIYVVDSYNNRLSAWSKDGKRLWIVRTGKRANAAAPTGEGGALAVPEAKDLGVPAKDQMGLPLGITIDGAGRPVVVDMFGCSLNVFDPKNGKFIGSYGDAGPEDGAFFYPVSVDYDKTRDWFTVADAMNNRAEIVRIPGSAGGNALASGIGRAFTGPARACILPLLLILILIIAWLVYRRLRKRREEAAADAGQEWDDESSEYGDEYEDDELPEGAEAPARTVDDGDGRSE